MGGDSGHGGRTVFELKDLASTDMRVSVKFRDERMVSGDAESVAIHFGGDSELDSFIATLKQAHKVLSEMRDRNDDAMSEV